MNRIEEIKAGIKTNIHANKIKNEILKRLNSKKNNGATIVLNLKDFLNVSGRFWETNQNAVIIEFTERLKMFLQTIQVKYENDLKLHVLIDGQWYELTKNDWINNLTDVLKEVKAPVQLVNTSFVNKLYLNIVDLWKQLDPDYKTVSKLLG